MEIWKVVVSVATGIGGLAAFAYYVNHLAHDALTANAVDAVRRAVVERQLLPASRSAFLLFRNASDRFFGPHLFSFKAIFRSILLSLCWIVCVTSIFCVIYPPYSSWIFGSTLRPVLAKSAGLLLIASIGIDILSVAMTRWLARVAIRSRLSTLPIILLLDAAITVVLFYTLFSAAKLLAHPAISWSDPIAALSLWLDPRGLPTLIQALNDLRVEEISPGVLAMTHPWETEIVYAFPESVVFYSSLLSSLWLWFYATGVFILFAAVRIDRLKTWLTRYFNFEHHPVAAIGLVLVIGAAFVGLVVLVLAVVGSLVS